MLRYTLVLSSVVLSTAAYAHPPTSIVVDDAGTVYFAHGEVGIWKLDTAGELSRHPGPAWHFMIEDPDGSFKRQRWPAFWDGELVETGRNPTLLCGSSFPIAIGTDGALYYPNVIDDTLHVFRLEPGGEPERFATPPVAMEIGYYGDPVEAKWLHGLAAGPDGSLYYAEKESVRRIDAEGNVSTVAENIPLTDCGKPPAGPDHRGGPILRSLAVAKDGTIYVAAMACNALLRITPKGEVSVAVEAEAPWAAAGVALRGDDVYVLEFKYIDVEAAREWLPRVRKLTPDGQVTELVTITAVPEE